MDSPKSKTKINKQEIVKVFIQMLNTIKMFHWKTYSYAKHEATDLLYKDLNKYIDEFIETMLGKYNTRIPSFELSIQLKNYNSSDKLKEEIFKYKKYIIDLNNVLDIKKDSDLLNIRDEILACLNQFLYLFSFKR
jgi:DNA-binding ferritin-like protein